MKNLLKYIIIALCTVLFASCQEKTEEVKDPVLPVTPTNINGLWQLSEWNGSRLPEGVYHYIEVVRRDKKFTSYSNISQNDLPKETGNYNLLDDEALGGTIIKGRYDNSMNREWDNSYLVTDLTSARMVWTVVGTPDDVRVYTRIDAIPSDITGEPAF